MAHYANHDFSKALPPKAPPRTLDDALNGGKSADHPFLQLICDSNNDLLGTDLADIAHFLCLLHGRYPGLIDFAATRCADPMIGQWLTQSCQAFVGERALMTKLTVSAGPIASTEGQDKCTPTIIAMRSALNNLSQSDREGCAMGAAFALALDWVSIRHAMHVIAKRVDIEVRDCELPSPEATYALAQMLGTAPLVSRAMAFGASQMLSQHQIFWDMLEHRREQRRIQNGVI